MVVISDPFHVPEEIDLLDDIAVDDRNPALLKYKKPAHIKEPEDEIIEDEFDDFIAA